MVRFIVFILSIIFFASCAPQNLTYERVYSFVLGQLSLESNFNRIALYPKQTLVVGSKFIVVDQYNSRVLIWNDKSNATRGSAADVVLGQPNLSEFFANNEGLSDKSLNNPVGVTSDGTKLFVSDTENNRILIWNTIPTTDFQAANMVLGQPDFISNGANNGVPATSTQSSLYLPKNIFYSGGKLLVADSGNNRVLIWDVAIAGNNQVANLVIGQPNFTTRSAGVTNAKFRNPFGVWTNGTKVLVSDTDNRRVLAWNTFPLASGQVANWVLGQTLFTTRTANLGGLSASSLNNPAGVFSDGTTIVVSDTYNLRVLVYNAWPTANKPSANFVLGQEDFASSVNNFYTTEADTLHYVESPYFTADQLIVGDGNRVLYYDRTTLANGVDATEVLGQLNFSEISAQSTNRNINLSTLLYPSSATTYANKFIVADCNANRVLIWNTIPKDNYKPADVVLGQPDGTSIVGNNGGISASSLSCPTKVDVSSSGKLIVNDNGNNRVLIWNTIPTTNFAPASVVVGQPDFVSNAENNGSISDKSLRWVWSAIVAGNKLVVADYGNSRVLIWDNIPTTNFASANTVLGQPNFTSNTQNNGGVREYSMNYPGDLWSDGTKLILADTWNCRVLIWNTFPTDDQESADYVVGQSNFTSSTCGTSNLQYPNSVWSDGTKLFVPDSDNNRILTWNTIPTSDGVSPDNVFGQADLTTKSAGNGLLNLNYPNSIIKINHHYFIMDSNNSRIMAIHEDEF